MNPPTKRPLFKVNYAITDYEKATAVIIKNAQQRNSFGVSALAVHGLIESYRDSELREKVNALDMVVPDGQPVRWALNLLHSVGLKDRVCGPELTKWVLEASDREALKIYLYGSTETTLNKLIENIKLKYPRITICGVHVDRFREATPEEDLADIEKINSSGAHIVLVGRGCPRQERWVANHLGKVNSVMMAVGAAFDFHAGTLQQAPKWMQRNGLDWLYRLAKEPRRLWKRYLVTNSYFIYLCLTHGLSRGRS